MRKPLIALLLIGCLPGRACCAAPAPAVTPPHQVDFGATDNVIALKPALTPYHAPGGPEADGSVWYMLALTNNQVRPASRVLLAGQPPAHGAGASCRIARGPRSWRWRVRIPAWWWSRRQRLWPLAPGA